MIDRPTLEAVKTIVVHGGGCPDGIASAILLHDALPEAEVRFIAYNSEEHLNLKAEPGMLFADFVPKVAASFVEAGAIVLDHHKGAKDIVDAFRSNGRFADEVTEPGVSGAMLCYLHVWYPMMTDIWQERALTTLVTSENEFVHRFARLAGIRDTWQRQSPDWNEACAQAETLRFYPESHWLDGFRLGNRSLWEERLKVGRVLVERHARDVKSAIDKAWYFTSRRGTRVVVFDGTEYSSDSTDVADADLYIGFGFLVDGGIKKMVLSLRTRSGYDCLGLAQRYGGGGHLSAAGFQHELKMLTPHPYDLCESLVNMWEDERK